jgi:hypothetical protein
MKYADSYQTYEQQQVASKIERPIDATRNPSAAWEDRQVAPKELSAERLFYHYLQKELLESDIWLFQMLTARLVVALGVWLHPTIYEQLPLLVPYAVRDPACRGNKARGVPDEWGAPDARGYFRDDNSLIKGLPRPLPIESPSKLFHNRRIGRGFVAAHIWRELTSGELASRNALTYSFVPNLVWLPADVAALTDREGSFVQSYTQALSAKIYRNRIVSEPARTITEKAWELLPQRQGIPSAGLPDTNSLNYFVPSNRWLVGRFAKIRSVASALEAAAAGSSITGKIISQRYTDGLKTVDPDAALALQTHLQQFHEIAPSGVS